MNARITTPTVTRKDVVGAAPSHRSLLVGVVTMIGSATGNQVGAAVGAHAFYVIGPAGVVAIRQIVAAAVLLPVARPPFWRFSWGQWWPTLLLAGVFACMNLCLYTAIDRVGLGIAVTIEFLGPLTVALAGSRTRIDLLCAAGAGVGVYVLVLPGPSSDYIGLSLAMAAAACWACYILLNRLIGTRLPGLQAPAVATSVSALAYLPLLVLLIRQGRLVGAPLLYAISAGVLSSVVPYAADLVALRAVPVRFFGVFMSLNPVLAAVAGIIVLRQVLRMHEWIGITIIVLVNSLALASARRQPDRNANRTRSSSRCSGAALAQ